MNTDSTHACELAILGRNNYLPWRAAKVCFEHQRDFNYLEARHLWEDAEIDADGIKIAGMRYRALILEEAPPTNAVPVVKTLEYAGRIIWWQENMSDADLIEKIDRLVPIDLRIFPDSKDLRVRHVVKEGRDYYILFNEEEEDLEVQLTLSATGERYVLDPETGAHHILGCDAQLQIIRHAIQVVMIYTD